MTSDEFWRIIDTARADDAECEAVAARVKEALENLSLDDVLGFQRELDRRMAESYRWDLWAIAYIVNGGCSDDGFEYFRGWLLSKGRAYFEAALADPIRAADQAEPDVNECEDMLYVAASVYRDKQGEFPPKSDVPFPPDPIGEPWEEDDLPSRYPELWERYS